MKKELKVWAITLFAFWLLAPNKIFGQTDSLDLKRLDDVVITAGKFPKNRSQTGKVTDIISREDIEKTGARDIAQLLHGRAGLFVNGAFSNPGKDKGIYLRGASPQHSLVMIDGVPVSDPSGVNGVFDLRLIPLNNIERIEILKGGQSTLYGSDALAGVINIITRQPVNALNMSAALYTGSYNQTDAAIQINGTRGKFGYAAGYSYLKSGGISEALDTSGAGSYDDDSFKKHAFDFKIDFNPAGNLKITPFLQYSQMDGDYDAGAFTDSEVNTYKGDNLRFGVTAGSRNDNNAWMAMVVRNSTQRSFDSDFGTFNAEGSVDHAEAYLLHTFSDKWQIMGGMMLQNQQITSGEIDDMQTLSPYITVFFKNENGFVLESGVRYNYYSSFGAQSTFSINPSWQMSKQWKVFMNYATAFKAPTLTQLFGQFGANPDLQPEFSRSIEGGFSWIDDSMNFSATVFRRVIDDIIIYTDRYMNSDFQQVAGLELEGSADLTSRFQANLSYTWLNGRSRLRSSDSTFNGLIRQPDHSFNARLSYQVTESLSTDVSLNWFGSRKDVYFDLQDFTNQVVSLQPYTLLDLRVRYTVSSVGISLFGEVRNLLDTDYYESFGYAVMGRTWHGGIRWNGVFD